MGIAKNSKTASADQATVNASVSVDEVSTSQSPVFTGQTLFDAAASGNFSFLSSGLGAANEQLEPIIKQLNKMAPSVGQIDIFTIDDKLEFPTLVVGYNNPENKRYYYTALLVTGNNPKATHTVESYMQRVEEVSQPQQPMFGQNKQRNSDISILLQDNALNSTVLSIIAKHLPDNGDDMPPIGLGFFSLALTEVVTDDVAREIGATLINSLLMGVFVENNQKLDRRIEINKDTSWNINVHIVDAEGAKQTGRDVLGHYYARPYIICSKGSRYQDSHALGVTGGTDMIMESEVAGVLDYKFETLPERVVDGIRVPQRNRAIPEFIITRFNSDVLSITSFLLSLANSIQIMSKKECSYACQIATKGKANHFANMNVITNIEENPDGGKILDAKKLTPEACVGFLDNALLLDAGTIVSMKIDATNTQSYLNQVILGLVGSTEERAYFKNLICNAVKVLTNRDIPAFDGPIIDENVVRYPIGTYANSNGVHSLDLLNVNEFIELIKGNELIDILTEMDAARVNPASCCKMNGKTFDSFVGGVKALKAAGWSSARITGMGHKVTFTAEFIEWLVAAINSTGYTPTIDAPVTNATVIERKFSQYGARFGAKATVNASSYGSTFSFGTSGSGFGREFNFRR